MTDDAAFRQFDRVRTGGRPSPGAVVDLFRALDWTDVALQDFRIPGASVVLETRAAAQPRTLVVVGEAPQAERSACVTYSRETPYLVTWGGERISLHDARHWRQEPGDAPVFSAHVEERERLSDLFALLRRPEVLSDVAGSLHRPGTPHAALPHRLAEALATLRLRLADAQALRGADIEQRDASVLALFHQLLYIRVVEDRGSSGAPRRIEDLLDASQVAQRLADLGRWYERHLDSELFEPSGVPIEELPASALMDVLRALVEPWHALKLDFSVVQAELAGRLYESYLASVPALEGDEDMRLFSAARALDRRDVQASFYTPPGLARAVTERTLNALVGGGDVDPFAIRVLDPACGSGAFLLAAFRWLRRYAEGRLTRELRPSERSHLLQSCLFGADVDERALALTRVQLLEEAELTGRLPKLTNNLLLGDALACPPNADGTGAQANAVDWDSVLARGGPFSAVIGNPPFGSEAKLPKKLPISSIRALDRLYPEVRGFGRDYAYLFGALALRLVANEGTVGLVMPRKLLEGSSGSRLRGLLAERGIEWLADLRAAGVFPAVKTRACVVILAARPGGVTTIASVRDSREEPSRALDDLLLPQSTYLVGPEVIGRMAGRGWSEFRLRWEQDLHRELSDKVEPLAPPHHPTRDVRFGTKPARVDRLVLGPDDWERVGRKISIGDVQIAERYAPSLVYARDIKPFVLEDVGRRLLLPFERNGEATGDALVTAELERRGGLPPNFQRGDLQTLLGPKVLLRVVAREPAAVEDRSGRYLPIMRGALAIRADDLQGSGLTALAAILNGALYQWLLRGLGSPLHDESVELSAADVRALPVPVLTDDAIEALVQQAEAIRAALGLDDQYLRAREYRRRRHELDVLVFELAGASPRLRTIVLEELIREA